MRDRRSGEGVGTGMSASAICLYDVTSREKVPTRQKISNDLSGKSIADMSCAVSSGKV